MKIASCFLDPLQDTISCVQLVRVSGSDLDIVNAARVSYGKTSEEFTERDQKLINFLMEHKHTSPFEHNQFSFRIKAPIFVVRQWMRHRMNSYNEISYRYAKAPLEFYVPHSWRHQDTVNKQGSLGTFNDEDLKRSYQESINVAVQSYELLLAQGVSREQARALLPVCTYSEFIFTTNLHSLLHFLSLRLSPGAQYEIRMFAQALYYLAKPHFPASFSAWEKSQGLDANQKPEFNVAFGDDFNEKFEEFNSSEG